MSSATEFRVDVARDGGRVCINVGGELDGASSGELRNVVTDLLRENVASIDISLREVTFMDSGGLRALLAGRALADKLEIPFWVTELSTQSNRLLELTALHNRLVKPVSEV